MILLKAHYHMNYIICSFNALHHYPPEAEADHLEVCADRIALRNSTYLACKKLYNLASYLKLKLILYLDENAVGVTGNLSMPPPAQIEVVVDESWDD